VRWSRILVAFAAAALSLVVVFGNPQTAQALTPPVPPLVIGTTTAAPGVLSGAATMAGACLATPVCLAIGSAALIMGAAYLAKDSGIPVLGDAWDFGAQLFSNAAAGCTASFDSPQVTGPTLSFGYSWSNCTGSAANGLDYIKNERVVCRTSPTSYAYGALNGNGMSSDGSSALATGSITGINVTLCPSGQDLVHWRGRIQIGGGPAGYSRMLQLGVTIPQEHITTTTTALCRKADGSTGVTTVSYVGFTGVIGVPSCHEQYPGSTPENVSVTRGPTGLQETIATVPMTNPRTLYPDCFGAGGEWLDTCRVRVWIGGNPCVAGMLGCNDPEEYHQDNPTIDWDCKWGPYTVDKSNCAPLKNHYGAGPGTEVTLDPTGTPVTDPNLQEPEVKLALPPWLTDLTDPFCVTSCIVPEVPPDPEGPTQTQQNCLGAAFSFNPVNWVLVPVKCALTWAFVPENAPSFSDIPSPIPAGWVPSFPSLGDGSCGPIGLGAVDYPLVGTLGPFTLVDTCDEPGPAIRAVTYYGLLAVMLVGLGNRTYSALTRSVGMGVEGGDD